jgi:hypothetical protein
MKISFHERSRLVRDNFMHQGLVDYSSTTSKYFSLKNETQWISKEGSSSEAVKVLYSILPGSS